MKNNILAIGIDNYRNINQLNNCVKDLDNTIDVLLDKYDFDKVDIKRIYNAEATSENILFSLEDYLSKQSSGDNIVILFSGHGDFDTKLDLGYFLPVECYLDNKATYIPNTTLFNYIKAYEYRHIVLVSDTCFSGSLFPLTRSLQAPNERLFEIPSKWALTSGRIEKVMDGIPGQNSPFAQAIIKSLKENSSPLFSISELTRNVISEVASKNDQIPRGAPLQILGDKGGEFFFKLKSKSKSPNKLKPIVGQNDILDNLIDEYYSYSEKLEDAENLNKPATIRRLNEEMTFVKKALDREIVKLLELGKNDVQASKQLPNLLGADIEVLTQEINSANEKKIKFVKSQKFQDAAVARDKEKLLQQKVIALVLDKKSALLEIIRKQEDTIEQNFGILSLLTDMLPSNDRSSIRKLIDEKFIEILFLKLSKTKQLITSLRFEEKLLQLHEDIIPRVFKLLTAQSEIADYQAEFRHVSSGFSDVLLVDDDISQVKRKAAIVRLKGGQGVSKIKRPPKK